MRSDELAKNYINSTKGCLEEAELAWQRRDYPRVVRRSQEALELGIKAILRLFAIEYPKHHDISDSIPFIIEKIPKEEKDLIDKARPLIEELAKKRGLAMYGLEREGILPDRLFNKDYAEKIFNQVKEIVQSCNRIFNRFEEIS
jgi:HEPN domain-containing protein